MCSRSYSFTVEPEYGGISLKSYLRRAKGMTAHIMTALKYSEGITRCGELLRAHDILSSGDTVTLELPEDANDIEPVEGKLDVLFEDERLLIVNKPPYMPVHPTKVHQLDTLANIVSYYQRGRGEVCAFRALNRIDKDTSGCVIIAKDIISYALTLPTISKRYIAVCEGAVTESGVIDAPIALAPDSKIKRCVSSGGQRAVTHYEPVCAGRDHTLLSLSLETGRTHQIRCHMSHIGHPLAGDDMYGGSMALIDRQALHCSEVRLAHPVTGEKLTITAPVPADISALINSADMYPLPAVHALDAAEDSEHC